jgi:glutathione synthase/RimK-type ligase-like ATP-grasp enzyme
VSLCAFLTLDDPTGYGIDDDLTYEPLRQLGWRVEPVPWRKRGVAWGGFDAVVIRSTWDYETDPEAFLDVLDDIERSGTPLFNGLGLVRWNISKTYLRDLEGRGVPIVPTLWRERLAPGELAGLMEEIDAPEVVVKPVVGAGARGAYRLDGRGAVGQAGSVEAYYASRSLMAQPFLRAIEDEGEFSLIYFGGAHSHTMLKTPTAGDYRVQEHYGGLIRSVRPDQALLAAGELVLRALDEVPLYARVDLVRADDGDRFWLMELELIEPALYFRRDPGAPGRFARELDRVSRLRRQPGALPLADAERRRTRHSRGQAVPRKRR